MKIEEAQIVMENRFRKMVEKDSNIHNAFLLIHSEKLGIHLNMAAGSAGSMPAHPQQPYFIASVGKLFTSVLIGILVEQGKISYEETITSYLDHDLLRDLHVYKGKDYTGDIKIKHLLNHTSGLNDFFEDKPKQGKPMIDTILDEPSRFWTPQEVVQWSKQHLTSHFPPGRGFHYSDTGYHLLGLVIEKITTMPFHEALKHYIFHPLGMNHSYLLHYSEPMVKSQYFEADVYIRNKNVTQYRSLSIDYAGGGIVAPTEDLLKFMKALVKHEIVRKDTLEQMKDWAKFHIGIDYGYGLMNFKTVPLFMPKKYNMWGNAGMTGTFMFYHPELDTYFIGSLNQFRYHRKGIVLIFKMINILSKCDVMAG